MDTLAQILFSFGIICTIWDFSRFIVYWHYELPRDRVKDTVKLAGDIMFTIGMYWIMIQ